jgi:hypothetical protein
MANHQAAVANSDSNAVALVIFCRLDSCIYVYFLYCHSKLHVELDN